jgi:ABC-2 type transport system ATP-binding protein
MNDDTPVLETESLGKTFRDFWMRPRVRAVSELSLRIPRGEVLGLLGPNGSGKSTTIKMVLGLLRPTAGTVRVFGLPPAHPDVRARIGYLPEVSTLYRHLTPRETLGFFGALFDLPRAERRRRTDELLRMMSSMLSMTLTMKSPSFSASHTMSI